MQRLRSGLPMSLIVLVLAFMCNTCAKDDNQTAGAVTGEATPPAPIAEAGMDQTVRLNTAVQLDGSLSHAPKGGRLAYRWEIRSAPLGSVAVLERSDTMQSTLTPDREGAYLVRLTVTNGRASDEDQLCITAKRHFLDEILRINQIQCLGTHNSYHRLFHKPLNEQLDMGVRQFELDIHYNHGRGLTVYHIPIVDAATTCRYFKDALATLKAWSDDHPGHQVLFIFIEPKDDVDIDKLARHDAEVEAEILSIWPRERIFTPDDLCGEGGYASVRAAFTTRGWPTLGEVRQKAMFFVFDGGAFRDAFVKDNPCLKGRVMFARGGINDEFAGLTMMDDPIEDFAAIQAAVGDGHLIRTRAENFFVEPNDTRHRQALASGAQMISTDYPAPSWRTSDCFTIPGGRPSRGNPLTAPADCLPQDVEDLPAGR